MSSGRFGSEAGYSLAEVMVAIMILAIAVIPMVGMFDAGLRAALLGGNYDRARALAAAELDGIRALPYHAPDGPAGGVRELYPPPGPHACRTGVEIPPGFTCRVRTAFVSVGPPGSPEVVEDPAARTMMRVEVTVVWSGGRSYSTTGLVAR
ncbi:prepilin-type N-terminal cleavage/methylation domain-containing protein [Rubrobacter taiwanensis]|uniref:Prepilin-type N-terminal cleavage/methylation domain-containing protein n=1 Tax=Rubrobacter taiwanensis TaxID=185139 RepID=A0A4V2NWA9_9ACTN|nr:prepilin-type N-terminal cleavage/methylation domain-containing protein [Rubrobacter taiwanensis]TCJ16682.1 prepilin-type N-terminal cleavage/methylation domain-containing protein [Rubrobacter taiwanensis]